VFSDRHRAPKLVLALLLLLGLGAWYAHIAMNLEAGYRWCLEDPAGRDGERLVFPLWVVTRVDGPDTYAISKIVPNIPVKGDATVLKVGDTVSILGTFDATDLTVREEVREVHTLRKWKERLGVLGFLVVAAAAPFCFRIRAGRLEEKRG
jgi:hypothetical protein